MAKTAVFGGTFNPFHIGHYEILSMLCNNDMFDRVLLVPDRIPPHKEYSRCVEDSDRIRMCQIVCEDFAKAELCLIEFEREGKSYTIDTVKALKRLYPGDEFYITCGGDMIKTLDSWYRFDELKKLASFIAVNRGNSKSFLSDVERLKRSGADITVLNDRVTEISSTELRNNIKREFLPEKVWEYVNKRGIYKQQNN